MLKLVANVGHRCKAAKEKWKRVKSIIIKLTCLADHLAIYPRKIFFHLVATLISNFSCNYLHSTFDLYLCYF